METKPKADKQGCDRCRRFLPGIEKSYFTEEKLCKACLGKEEKVRARFRLFEREEEFKDCGYEPWPEAVVPDFYVAPITVRKIGKHIVIYQEDGVIAPVTYTSLQSIKTHFIGQSGYFVGHKKYVDYKFPTKVLGFDEPGKCKVTKEEVIEALKDYCNFID